ncbi:MAG: RNA methyltransferase [Raineya sp.]|jgi:TrmH family RNA methyltransferase|nr:RNA methyltransferase [Raineya sp.]
MVSKKWQKLVKSLQYKKYRKEEGLFFVEGAKSVLELLHSDFKIEILFATDSFLEKTQISSKIHIETAKEQELIDMGTLQSNQDCLAVVYQKENKFIYPEKEELLLMLDDIQDPGNMGTIVRICDWYGVKKVVASNQTVDLYNPKVINSSMGSFLRTQIFYTDLKEYLSKQTNVPVYGTLLEGENIHTLPLSKNGILMMGNEANGISDELIPFITQKVTIPKFGGAESLNVAIATAVAIDNFMRK